MANQGDSGIGFAQAMERRLGAIEGAVTGVIQRMENLRMEGTTGQLEDNLRDGIQALKGEIRDLTLMVKEPKKNIKLGKPKPFSGDPRELQGFLTMMELHLEEEGLERAKAAEKIRFVATYLIDDAWEWFEPILREQKDLPEDERDNRVKDIFSSYENFKKYLKKAFGEVNEERIAERKILHLKQTSSVRKYTVLFMKYASHINWSVDALTSVYRRGLKPEIQDALIYFEMDPENFDGLVERAQMIDRRQWEARMDKKDRDLVAVRKPKGQKNGNGKQPRLDDEGDVVMVGAQAKVSKEECRKQGSCFHCGKKGHQAKNCRSKKSQGKERRTEEIEARMATVVNEEYWSDTAEDYPVLEMPDPEECDYPATEAGTPMEEFRARSANLAVRVTDWADMMLEATEETQQQLEGDLDMILVALGDVRQSWRQRREAREGREMKKNR